MAIFNDVKNQNLHTYFLGASSLLAIIALSITFSGIKQNNQCDRQAMNTIQEHSSLNCANARLQNQVKLVDNIQNCSIKTSTNPDISVSVEPKSDFVEAKSSGNIASYHDERRSIKHLKANSSLNLMLETYSVRKIEGQTKSGTNITGFEFTVETFQGSFQHLPSSPFSVEPSEPTTSQSAPKREISRWNIIERWRAFKRNA